MLKRALSGRAPGLGAYLTCLFHCAGPRLWVALGFLVVTGALESARLILLFPLLAAIGVGQGVSAGGRGGWGVNLLHQAHLPATPFVVLSIFVAITVGQSLLRAYANSLSLRIQVGFTQFLRDRFYRAMIAADWLFVSRLRASDLTQTLTVDLRSAGDLTPMLLNQFATLVTNGARVAVAVYLSPGIAAIALVSGAAVAWGLRKFRARVLTLGEGTRQYQAEMAAAVTEHLAGLKIVKSHGKETFHLSRYRQAMDKIAQQTLRVFQVNAAAGIWRQTGSVLGMAIFFGVALTVAHVSAARLLVLAYIFTELQGVQSTFQFAWDSIVQTLPSFTAAERSRQGLLAAAEVPEPAEPQRIPLDRQIAIENVSFRYDPALPTAAVRNLNLSIPARSVIALCGPSGAGKSTTADLILGLLNPSEGRILIDGRPLTDDQIHHWRQSIGYVPQETFLFHDSVKGNLRWAKADATDAELRTALQLAAAEGFVDKLPAGWDTVLGDRGVRLSGGERQRIALARAVLRRPSLLVLDEATSALDTENERLIQEAIESLRGETTILIIAHRLSTVRMADRIAVMREGRVVETGNWEELAGREDGAFRQLLAAGTGDFVG